MSTEAGDGGAARQEPGSGEGGLKRQLGLIDAAAVTAGNILGSGVFVAPAAVAAAATGFGSTAAIWILGGIIAACGAFCYAECGTRLPHPGGFYVFYRAVYGRPVAFVGGWAALLITYPASIAAIAIVFGQYARELAPGAAPSASSLAAAALVIVGLLNIVGVRAAAWAQRFLTVSKVGALAAVCLTAVIFAGVAPQSQDRPSSPEAAAPAPDVPWTVLLGAIVVVLWTYDGWSDLSLLAGEVRDPGRVLGRAVVVGMLVLVALYIAVQMSVGALLPPGRAAASDRVVAEAVESGLGVRYAWIVALLVALTTFGSVHGVTLTSSRIGYAMARDRTFFDWFGAVHPRFGTPARSVALVTAASLVYVFAAGFRNLLGFFSFSVWFFYGLTAIALLVLRRKGIGGAGAWRAPGGLLAPAVVLLTAAGMTSSLMAEDPKRSLIGLTLLLAGFPVYAAWHLLGRLRKGAPEAGLPR